MAHENHRKPSPELIHHPLMGVRLSNLFHLLSGQKDLLPHKWPYIYTFAASALIRSPFSMIDRWIVTRKKAVEKIAPPVFIVGFWRSGTTHLHNLLSQCREFGIITPIGSGLPDELLTLGTWLQWVLRKGLPEDRGVDNVNVNPESPQEDVIPMANLQPITLFRALYFPNKFREHFNRGVFLEGVSQAEIETWKSRLQYLHGKVALHQGRSLLLIKNPVYMTRIRILRALWPGSRFIHIHRNPYDVYQSNINYYPNLIDTMGFQAYDVDEVRSTVRDSYPKMMEKLFEDTRDLPDDQFIEVSYDDVDKNPLGTLEKIYHQLHLPGWESARHSTKAYLKTIADYKTNKYVYEQEDIEAVDAYWGKYVKKWDYKPPKIEPKEPILRQAQDDSTGASL
jgi:hypothetical protein